jgi:predicted transposase YdaD
LIINPVVPALRRLYNLRSMPEFARPGAPAMARPFDATLKDLVDAYAADWAVFLRQQLGLPIDGPAEVIESDVSTVSAQADKVFRVQSPEPALIHLELQSGPDSGLPRRALLYNVLLDDRYELPVLTVIVLLKRGANLSNLTGALQCRRPDGSVYLAFEYKVIRLWELPPEPFLTGPLGIVPLAPLAAVAIADLPGMLRRMDERFHREAGPGGRVNDLLTATNILMGLCYPTDLVNRIFEEVRGMEESVTYQQIVKKGQLKEARRLLLLQGRYRFGPPSPATVTAFEGIDDLVRLERMAPRLFDAADWDDLLATP